MWYWLEGLIHSKLIEQSLLSIIYVAGFLIGFLCGSILLARTYIRYGWILIVLIGAFCTKGLITIFEWLKFYNWDMMVHSPFFLEFSIIFLAVLALLIFLLLKAQKKRYRKYYRRY